MEFLRAFFNQGWIGSMIGILGIIIGIYFYKASQAKPRLSYQLRALKLIGNNEQALPEEVKISFSGKNVPQLTMTHVIYWNSGKAMIDGKNITKEKDPLRIVFREQSEVLRVRILKITRETNKFTAKIKPGLPNEIVCNFDYLDPKDGAVIEILHTDEHRYPEIKGTIRGMHEGLLDLGQISPSRDRLIMKKTIKYTYLMLSPALVTYLIFFRSGHIQELFHKLPYLSWIYALLHLFGVFFAVRFIYFGWYLHKKRFPVSLLIEELD